MPVLGYNTVGLSDFPMADDYKGSVSVTDELGGVVTKFHCAIASGAGNVKIGVCETSGGNPSGQDTIEQVEIPVSITDDLWTGAPTGNTLSADTSYYLPIITDGNARVKYDSGEDLVYWYLLDDGYADAIKNPLPNGFSSVAGINVSVWIEYGHSGILGYDTPGASSMGNSTIVYGGSYLTDGAGSVIAKFHVAMAQIYGPLDAVKIVVADCKQIDGDPSGEDVIEQIEIHPVIVSDDNEAEAVGSNLLEANTKYYIGILSASGATKWKYDSGVGVTLWFDAQAGVNYAAWFPDPCRSPYGSSGLYAFSVWIDLEPPPPVYKSILDSGVGTDLVEISKTVFIVDVGSLLSEIVMSREALLRTMKIINAMDFNPKLSKAKKTETPRIMEAE